MEIGLYGLGRMGGNMVTRLARGGHRVVAGNRSPEPVREAVGHGAAGAGSIEELVKSMKPPRVLWSMVPAGEATDHTLDEVARYAAPGDVLVDGANSEFALDLQKVTSVWLQGSVVRSWLLELAERAFVEEGTDLQNIKGRVADSGEGRWTIIEAIGHEVPMTAIAHSLFARFVSRQEDSYAMKVAAALRNQFGGHAVTKSASSISPLASGDRAAPGR